MESEVHRELARCVVHGLSFPVEELVYQLTVTVTLTEATAEHIDRLFASDWVPWGLVALIVAGMACRGYISWQIFKDRLGFWDGSYEGPRLRGLGVDLSLIWWRGSALAFSVINCFALWYAFHGHWLLAKPALYALVMTYGVGVLCAVVDGRRVLQ